MKTMPYFMPRHRRRRMRAYLAVVLLIAINILAYPPAPAHAASIVSSCTEAGLSAALASGGAITFACDGTITLTSTKIISTTTAIDGAGHAITLSGDNARQLIAVEPGTALTIRNLTLADGYAQTQAGALYNNGGTVVVENSTFFHNSAGTGGGAILNKDGSLTVLWTTVDAPP